MRFVCLLSIVLCAVNAWAEADRYIRVADVRGLKCFFFESKVQRTYFEVTHGPNHQAVVTVQIAIPKSGYELLSKCQAAMFQAREDGKGVYINAVTGDVFPEDGFFTRSVN